MKYEKESLKLDHSSKITSFERQIKELTTQLQSKQDEVAQLKMELNLRDQERS